MAQRESGYDRIERDRYNTPAWCTEALVPFLRGKWIWEPAAGNGAMAEVLCQHFDVLSSDIGPVAPAGAPGGCDFLQAALPPDEILAIVTNPPYSQAAEFCRHALKLMEPVGGMVAMLLRVDFDSGKTRRDLFADNPAWAMKIVFLDRVRWFEPEDGKGSPSENHAWYLWDFQHTGWPQIHYAQKEQEEF